MTDDRTDCKCELYVNGELKRFDVISGHVAAGKFVRQQIADLTGDRMTRNDVRRFFNGADYTVADDENVFTWRCRPYVSTFDIKTVIKSLIQPVNTTVNTTVTTVNNPVHQPLNGSVTGFLGVNNLNT